MPISRACRKSKKIGSIACAGAVALTLAGGPAASGPRTHEMTPLLADDTVGQATASQPFQSAQSAPNGSPDGQPGDGIVSELRLGAMAHDVGIFGRSKEDGVDVNGELLFGSPRFLRFLWSPRPHIGVTYAPGANTTSQVYFGLTWQYTFWRGAFIEGSFGGSVNDGSLVESTEEKALGCHLLFRESISLGYTFERRHSVMVTLDHISNANLCDLNEGLDTIGIRYGYRF